MNISNIVKKYLNNGNNRIRSQNLAAEEIIIRKMAASQISNIVTIKGGMIMYNLSKNKRRVTQDIDFDLLRYALDTNSINALVARLNNVNDGVSVVMVGEPEELHQEDYKGKRISLKLTDDKGITFSIKLDIGVHTYHAIEQEVMVFEFGEQESVSMKVNPCEQVFAEKLLSLSRHAEMSTRYKDIYDMYYLIENKMLVLEKVKETLSLFLMYSKRGPKNLMDLSERIEYALNDKHFIEEATKPLNAWIDVDYEIVKKTIVDFINKL